MKRILILAVLAVALVAMPAVAAVTNVKVGGSIDSTWLVRDQFDLGLSDTTGSQFYQNLLITQAILDVSADLTDNVSAMVRLINERQWGDEGRENDGTQFGDTSQVNSDVAICIAALTLKEFLYSPLTLILGRQHFSYGNSLVVDSTGPNNTSAGVLGGVAADLSKRAAMDAVRAILNYDPLTIDIVAAKIDSRDVLGATGAGDDDINLFGTNANYKLGDSRNTEVEGYFWAKLDESLNVAASPGQKADSVYTTGARASTNPIKGLNVQGEVAWQFGNKATTTTTARNDNQQRQAMAAQLISSYAVSHDLVAKWNPVVAGWATYLSGDENSEEASNHLFNASSEKWTAWDPMFENQSGGTIYNTLFDYTNAIIGGSSLQVNPIEDVTAKLTYTSLWIATNYQDDQGASTLTLRQPDGSTISANVTDNRFIGSEVDLDLTYQYTEDVQFGLSYGMFMPGAFFHINNRYGSGGTHGNNDNASQWLVNADVIF